MDQVKESIDRLVEAIGNSEEFIRFKSIREKVHGFPELERQIMEFRRENYLLQNSQGKVDLFDETDRIEREYKEFRENPMVSEYLSAENDICTIVQQINWRLIEELDFEVGFEE